MTKTNCVRCEKRTVGAREFANKLLLTASGTILMMVGAGAIWGSVMLWAYGVNYNASLLSGLSLACTLSGVYSLFLSYGCFIELDKKGGKV